MGLENEVEGKVEQAEEEIKRELGNALRLVREADELYYELLKEKGMNYRKDLGERIQKAIYKIESAHD